MDLKGIDKVFEQFQNDLNTSKNSQQLRDLINKSYLSSDNLSEATQKLVQELFGKFGLLMLGDDDVELKKLMIPAFETDLIDDKDFEIGSNYNEKLIEKNHNVQLNSNEINQFYLNNS